MKDFELEHPENDSHWVEVTGYKFRYQVSEEGLVRKEMQDGTWKVLRPYMAGKRRACVKMRTLDNRKVDVPVVWLVADAFLGGRRPGLNIVHKNGSKFDCGARNLKFLTKSECAKLSESRRRPVMKLDKSCKVIAIYPSVNDAAKANFISKSAVQARCAGQVRDPYRLDGFNYKYET